jgi:hypothetical protein
MEESELLDYAKDPTKIISPVVCDELLFWASGYLGDKEETLAEVDLQVAQRRLNLIDTHGSVAKAEAYLEVDDIYLQQKKIERDIRKLKAFKTNVSRRYQILTNRILNKYGQ